MALSPIDELDQVHSIPTEDLSELLGRIESARLRLAWEERDRLVTILGGILGQIQSGADLLGRIRLLREAKALGGEPAAFAALRYAVGPSGLFFLPRVAFQEASEELLARFPEVAPGWRATAEVYAEGGFAAARAASAQVAEHVQKVVETAIRRGTSQELVERRILQALRSGSAEAEALGIDPAGFTRAYADTVFRTVSSSSYARGRRLQAESPAVRKATAGWRFTAVGGRGGDGDTRPNHRAADGLVAHFDDPVWAKFSPPLGYNCRCSLELVPTVELRLAGLADKDGAMIARASAPPPPAGPDDRFITGGGPLPR